MRRTLGYLGWAVVDGFIAVILALSLFGPVDNLPLSVGVFGFASFACGAQVAWAIDSAIHPKG